MDKLIELVVSALAQINTSLIFFVILFSQTSWLFKAIATFPTAGCRPTTYRFTHLRLCHLAVKWLKSGSGQREVLFYAWESNREPDWG